MPKFRRLTVIVEARQADGTPESNRDIIDWTRDSLTKAFMDKKPSPDEEDRESPCLSLNTMAGTVWVPVGAWVVKTSEQTFDVISDKAFAAAYRAEPELEAGFDNLKRSGF